MHPAPLPPNHRSLPAPGGAGRGALRATVAAAPAALALPGRASPGRTVRVGAHRRSASRGFILSYVLYSLILISIATLAFSRLRPANDQSAQVAEAVDRLDRAIDTLTLGVQMCATEAPVGATVQGIVTAWPVVPDDPLAVTPTLEFGTAPVPDMRCPGLTGAAQRMWTGRDSNFYPQPPAGFAEWRYTITRGCGVAPTRVESITLTIEAQTTAAEAALRRVQIRRPAQRDYDPDTGVLTVTLLSDPCPT